MLDGLDVVYVARVPTRERTMSIALNIGAGLPCHATSLGRVLLAGLPENQFETFLSGVPLEAYTYHTVTDPDVLREITREVRRQGWPWSTKSWSLVCAPSRCHFLTGRTVSSPQ